VKILFADEEELTGYVFDWKDPGDKFYFLPKEMGLNIMFFLIERNTLKEMKLLAEDALAARQGAKKFAGILKKMSWVSE
jgi:hypothetical protein